MGEHYKKNEKFIPLIYNGLTERTRMKAKNELNETDENFRRGLQELKAYAKKENILYPEEYFLQCLRVSKYDIKKSKEKLKHYWLIRHKKAHFFRSVDAERLRIVLDHKILGLLPYRDDQGRAIMYSRAHAWNPEICDVEDLINCCFALIMFLLSFPTSTISGATYITDAKVNRISDIYILGNTYRLNMKPLFSIPFRLQRVDILNENTVVHWVYNLIRPLLPGKISKRVFMHGGNIEGLQKAFDESILPHEFGGTMGPLCNDFLTDKVLEFVEKLKKQYKDF